MFFVMGLMKVTVGALVELTVFLPMSQLVTVCAERSSAMSFGDIFEVSEEG